MYTYIHNRPYGIIKIYNNLILNHLDKNFMDFNFTEAQFRTIKILTVNYNYQSAGMLPTTLSTAFHYKNISILYTYIHLYVY